MADPLQRGERISQLLAKLTAENAPDIAKAFEHAQAQGIKFNDELRLFLRAWGKVGGASAVEYAVSKSGQESGEALSALGGWAAASPQQAKAWIDALPESSSKETLIYGLLDGWSTIDFRAAAAYAESRPRSNARENFRELLLQRALRAGGITAAQNWVDAIPGDDHNREYKKRAFGEVIQAMLYRDPSSAARWISELDGQAFVGSEAMTNTAAKLAESSPTGALDWLKSLSKADAKTVASSAGAVVQSWAKQDPQAAGNWLGQNTNHPFFDRMAASYSSAVAAVDRGGALEWANAIHDEKIRAEAIASMDDRKKQYDLAMRDSLVLSEWIGDGDVMAYAAFKDGIASRDRFLQPSVLWSRLDGQRVNSIDAAVVKKAEAAIEFNVPRKNPHGSDPKMRNCAECHR